MHTVEQNHCTVKFINPAREVSWWLNIVLFCLQLNQQFMRKIPEGSEAANILIGEMENLRYQVVAFVRLCEARHLGDITEVPVPSRFLFLLLGPKGSHSKNLEIGRSMSTIMVDEVSGLKPHLFWCKTRKFLACIWHKFYNSIEGTTIPEPY